MVIGFIENVKQSKWGDIMSKQLPEKIVQIDQIRINRGLDKVCKCESRKYTLDTTNRRVYCSSCGVQVDPYDAMYDMAFRWEQVNQQLKMSFEQMKQLSDYKPWLLTIRSLEKQYRGKKTLPCCPRCDQPFYLEELNHWMGKPFADAMIKRWREENDTQN